MSYDLILLEKRIASIHRAHPFLKHIEAGLLDKLTLFKQPSKCALLVGFEHQNLATQLAEEYAELQCQEMSFFKTLRENWPDSLTPKSFDLIILNTCLHWHPGPEKLFSHCHDLLKKDGILLFSTFGPDTLKELRTAFYQIDKTPHVNAFFDMHDLGDMLMSANFHDPVMSVERLNIQYPNALELMRDIQSSGQNNCDDNRHKTLTGKKTIRTVLHKYPQNTLNTSSDIDVSMELVYGHAIGQEKSNTVKLNNQKEVHIRVDQIGRNHTKQ